jgi:hypothetical protein
VQQSAELTKLIQAASYFQPAGAMIAGGALTSVYTGQPINDVDLYFKSQGAFCDAIESAYDQGLWCASATDRAVTFVHDNSVIQLMHFGFFADAAAVFDAFDFTCCMAAYDIDAKELVFHDDFLKHASQRHLSFHAGTRYPFGSLLRVLKYQARGYSIGKGDLLRIALACHKVELSSWDDLAAAIGGQYGDRVNLDGEGEFNIDAAIGVIAKGDFTIQAKGEEMPGDAEQLLARIGIVRALAA